MPYAKTKTKYRPRVGDRRWLVEWADKLGLTEDGEHDPDKSRYCTLIAETREEAAAMARRVYPQTVGVYGTVSYQEVVFEAYDEDDAARYPHAGFWEATSAETEYYEGVESTAAAAI